MYEPDSIPLPVCSVTIKYQDLPLEGVHSIGELSNRSDVHDSNVEHLLATFRKLADAFARLFLIGSNSSNDLTIKTLLKSEGLKNVPGSPMR